MRRRGAFAAACRPLAIPSTAAAATARQGARRRRHPPLTDLFAVLVLALLPALPAAAWTPSTQQAIAAEGAALAPPDLARQIEKHPRAYRQGVADPFADGDAARHSAAADGRLAETIVAEARRAVAMIEGHQPFEDVVRQLGVLAHYVADLNDPLAASDADPREGEYFADYARYLESAEPRLPLVFYGLLPGLERRGDLAPLVAAGVERGRELYPMVGREYRRIGFASGRGLFDDRSTAFGVGSLAFSHAVTDVAQALRWVWLQAGGGDPRGLPERGDVVLRLPRSAAGARPLPRLGR
ncbi:MAG TPA: hypothetical protein VHM02_01630 [Thermoanaerobaculia bacterium]|nr:hypothetical protein [Thermoanaerobaculia bacterium]